MSVSEQAWSISFVPIEILTITEALVSNSPTPLVSDTLVLTDASTVTNQPVVVDTLSNTTDSVAEAIAFLPVDTLTGQEILLDVLSDFSDVDLVFINEFPVYTDNNLLVDTIIPSDSLAFSQIFVPVDVLTSLDISTTTSIFALVDIAPGTSDTISNTEILMNTDVAYGDGTLDDSSTFFALTLSLTDDTLNTSDSTTITSSNAIFDVTVVTSDVIVPTDIPVLVDILNGVEILFLALSQTLIDNASILEILLSSSPANITDSTVTASDSITPTDIPVLVDITLSDDNVVIADTTSLTDISATSDSITPTDIPVLVDTNTPVDTINDSVAVSFVDINNQSTEYLFTPIMENSADATLTAMDLTINVALISNLIDTPTQQEILVTTNIFILNDDSLLPATEIIIESLAVLFPSDSQTDLESILLTDIPQGLTDQMVLSDLFMAIINPFITDSLTNTEINSVQISVQFDESFSEIEVNLLALVESNTDNQISEIEILLTTVQESDLATLTILDVSTTTVNAIGDDLIAVITDIEVEGDIFVPVDTMTSLEVLLCTEDYAAQEILTNTEVNITNAIAVPVDALLAQDLFIAETTIEILLDTPVLSDVSSMQDVFVPSDIITSNDAFTFALVYAVQDVLAQSDVSTTTVNNKNTDALIPAPSDQAWIVLFVPNDVLASVDASITMVTQFNSDMLTAQDVVPMLGYGLLDNTLNISEAITASAKVFVLVSGVIPSGAVKAIITNALVTGTIYSGEIQGVIP